MSRFARLPLALSKPVGLANLWEPQVTKGKKEISFFTIPEYETWKEENLDGRGWNIKYFKVRCLSLPPK